MKPWPLVSVVCVILALGVGVWSLGALGSAWQDLEDSQFRLVKLYEQVDEYHRLINEQEDTLFGTKPEQDIESRIASVIRSARISPTPRYSVSVQDDRALQRPGTRMKSDLREQVINISIPGLRVKQIGDFLLDWRENQKIWTPTRIELVHDQRAADDRYTLHLSCTAVYHGDGGS